jgi:hypothetical protein
MSCDYDCAGCNCDPTPRLRPWEQWLNSHEYIVWPTIGAVGLLAMFWLAQYV